MDKQTIIKNFTKCAYGYDRYADIQATAALELSSWLGAITPKRILEIGCGTANFTKILRRKFPQAKIKAIDISAKMIEIAQEKLKGAKVDFIVADGENLFLEEKFDLITSNACLQWFDNLKKALLKYNDFLNYGGLISFSVFGPLTFKELNISLNNILPAASIAADNFISKEEISAILKESFGKISVKETRHKQVLPSLKALLEKIKYTGTRGEPLNTKKHFTPRLLQKIENAYLDKFKKISATFQIFFFKVKKT